MAVRTTDDPCSVVDAALKRLMHETFPSGYVPLFWSQRIIEALAASDLIRVVDETG